MGHMGGLMKTRPSWHQYFLDIARIVATRSEDPNTQVGCVIVDSDKRIVSTGFNGPPSKVIMTIDDWDKSNKHSFVIHAEDNAVLYSRRNLRDCILYSTLEPCIECTKMICAAGIKTMYYLDSRPDPNVKKLLDKCGARSIQWSNRR